MLINLALVKNNFKTFEEISSLFMDKVNCPIDENSNSVKRLQILPSIYLGTECINEITGGVENQKSKFIDASDKIEDTITLSSIFLRMFCFKNNIMFAFEEISNPYNEYYTPRDSNFYFFLNIKRGDIINYQKKGRYKFFGVNAKKSIEMSYRTGMGAIRGGLLGFLLHRGISKIASNSEDDTELLEGFKYELCYKNDTLIVLVENNHSKYFEKFLNDNWTSVIPNKK